MGKGFVGRPTVEPSEGEQKPTGLLMRWSYSQWSDYEKCPAKVRYKQVDRLPEMGDRKALERGIHIHTILEDILNKKAPLEALDEPVPGKQAPLPTWKADVQTLLDNGATAEDKFALTQTWEATAWGADNAWLRGKLDARNRPAVIDYKTGRVYPDHVYQAELYATAEYQVAKALRLTVPDEIPVTFWYVDFPADDEKAKKTWVFRKDGQEMRIKAWNHRVSAMMNDTIFPHRPGAHCAWCGYSKMKGGPCPKN